MTLSRNITTSIDIHVPFLLLLLLLLLLCSRLCNFFTFTCVYLTIILSSSCRYFCHSTLLPSILSLPQSFNPFRPGGFRSTSFSSSRWTPFHNFFWQSFLFHSLNMAIQLMLFRFNIVKETLLPSFFGF